MIYRKSLCYVVVSAMFAVLGCNQGPETSISTLAQSSDEMAAYDVIATNSAAVTEEDVSIAMETVHPDSPLYKSTERALAQVFALDLDLENEFEITNVLSDEDTLRVDMILSTRKVGGDSPFMDNELTTTQVLRKHDGEWKIWSSEIVQMTWLGK